MQHYTQCLLICLAYLKWLEFVTLFYIVLPTVSCDSSLQSVAACICIRWAAYQIQVSSSDTWSDTSSAEGPPVLQHYGENFFLQDLAQNMDCNPPDLPVFDPENTPTKCHFFVGEVVFTFVEYSMKELGVFDSDTSSWQGIGHTLNNTLHTSLPC